MQFYSSYIVYQKRVTRGVDLELSVTDQVFPVAILLDEKDANVLVNRCPGIRYLEKQEITLDDLDNNFYIGTCEYDDYYKRRIEKNDNL